MRLVGLPRSGPTTRCRTATLLAGGHEFSGPARRSEFWYWALFLLVIGVIAWVLDGPSPKAVSAAPTQPGPAPAPV